MRSSDEDGVAAYEYAEEEGSESGVPRGEAKPFCFPEAAALPPEVPAEPEPAPQGPSADLPPEVRSVDVAPTSAEALDEAEQRGYERGLAEARTLVDSELASIRTHVESLEHAFGQAIQSAEAQGDQDAVYLALQLADRLVRGCVAHQESAVQSLVSQVLETLPRDAPATRIVAPEDTVHVIRELFANEGSEAPTVNIESSSELRPGDLRVFASGSEVDARLSLRLRRLQAALAESLGLELNVGDEA